MNSQMTIGKRVSMLAGVLMTLALLMGGLTIWRLSEVDSGIRSVTADAMPGLAYIADVDNTGRWHQALAWQHMATTSAADRGKIVEELDQVKARITKGLSDYEGTITQPDDRANFQRLTASFDAYLSAWESKALPYSARGASAEAVRHFQADVMPVAAPLMKELDVMQKWNRDWGDTAAAKAVTASATAKWWTGAMVVVLVGVGVGLSQYLLRGLNKVLGQVTQQIAESAEQVSTAAGEVAATSQSLAQGASEQAASLEETSASSEEINSMARKNSENSRSAVGLVTSTQRTFSDTNRKLDQMVVAMDEINTSSGKISKIIKVIDEIAFQTNILALNAAVEAARAGEAGMGFAVVADEVRNLAQRCAQAARDTSALIAESIGKSNEGKTKVDEVARAVRTITEESSKIKVLVDEVSVGSEEQTRGIEQVSKAITQMEQVTQRSAASAEQGAAAAEELNAQSETMRTLVTRLAALAGTDIHAHASGVSLAGRAKRQATALPKARSNPVAMQRPAAGHNPVSNRHGWPQGEASSIPMDEFEEIG